MKIAVIEDETFLNDAISTLLEMEGYKIYSFYNLKDFLKDDNTYNVIIADIALGDGNFLEEMKKRNLIDKGKIIIISSHSDIKNIKTAYNLGADDFIKKPFEPEEILIRIKKLYNLNRIKIDSGIFYDKNTKELIINNENIELTHKESMLLEVLLKNKHRFLSTAEIALHIWNEYVPDNTIAALVKRLRKKLGKKDLIISKREIGYKLNIT
ncbi:two-component system, OmpR family, response regulator [Lebetimonas natsushimae]|uniref:Two-component system, OmpR family, response regulator n=1 Tax=Lebetimonas natsushimae TaxID=1936991 RepID=A0A292YDQ9_9BACT|nr:response regulator transcription factor [Lebetimonas natsushimae]GAX87788.1 two-component system, OmpR family, response regulator [Lebetimonas natsushimae]